MPAPPSFSSKPLVVGLSAVLVAVGVAQTALVTADAPDPADVGRWTVLADPDDPDQPLDGGAPAVNLVLLRNGKLLYYSGTVADDSDDFIYFLTSPLYAEARVLDPVTGTVTVPTDATGVGHDLFCSGTTVLPDGRVLVAGGSDWEVLPDTGTPVKGSSTSQIFDPVSGQWSAADGMGIRRWYPSLIGLPDGDALVLSGIKNLSDPSTHNFLIERYDTQADSWTEIVPTIAFAPGVTTSTLFYTGAGEDRREWGAMNLPLYPRSFVVPRGPYEGQVFYSTVGTLWGTFGERPEEALWSFQQALDLDTGTWTVLGPSVFGSRQHGVTVPLLLDPAAGYATRLLTFGGTLERSAVAVPLAEMADLSTAPPTNAPVEALENARWHANGVLLPDGTVVAVGGGAIDNVVVHGQQNPAVLPAELFDPETGSWTTLASMTVARMYHSTAVLLPDGRVITAGHVPLVNPFKAMRDIDATGQDQVVETRFEVFEPPYLFIDDTRPTVAVDDAEIGYGEVFDVDVGDIGTGVHSVVLLRPGSTTHAFDADQRGIVLEATDNGDGTLTLTAPPDGLVAPPGWYMLFVNEDVDGQAFPSEAVFVHLT